MKSWTLKRLAWAYGCAKAGSEDERKLEEELRARCGDLRVAVKRLREVWAETEAKP